MRTQVRSRMIVTILAVSLTSLTLYGIAQDSATTKPKPAVELVTRGRLSLNLAGAEQILTAARGKATGMQVNVNIAVVDDGGHLIAFARMDKARPASISTALTKATAAATTRIPTGPVRRGDAEC